VVWWRTARLGGSHRRIDEENRRAGIGDLIVATGDLIVGSTDGVDGFQI